MSIGSSILQIGFGYIGTLVFNSDGVFLPGFTLSAIVAAIIYGIFLYDQPIVFWRIAVSTLLVTIFVNTLMNTLWIAWMVNFKINFNVLLIQRLAKEVVIIPWAQMGIIYFLLNAINNVKLKR